MVYLFPTSWASVSILKRITEALATEDVATFCRDNQPPILHNLEDIKRNSLQASLVPTDSIPLIAEKTSEMKGDGVKQEKEEWSAQPVSVRIASVAFGNRWQRGVFKQLQFKGLCETSVHTSCF